MPFYACVKNIGATIPSFQTRGIPQYMPGPVGDVPIFVHNNSLSSMKFAQAMSHIQWFVVSQLNGTFGTRPEKCVNVFKMTPVIASFEIPVGNFNLPTLSEDQQMQLRGIGLLPEPGRAGVWSGSPSDQNLSIVMQMNPQDGARWSPGSVNANGYLAYIYGLKAMTIFSAVSKGVLQSKEINISSSTLVQFKGAQDTGHVIWVDGEKQSIRMDPRYHRADALYTAALDDASVVVSSWDDSKSLQPLIINPNNLPEAMVGKFFGFFPGMYQPDKDYISHVFGSLFVHCLSNTGENCAKLWQRLRSGFRILSTTRAGLALSHAFLGIELARNAEVPIHWVILNNTYRGFVLEGAFTIHHYSEVIKSDVHDVLKADIASLTAHDIAIKKILEVLNMPLNADDMPKYSFTKSDLLTSRQIANRIYSIVPEEYTSTDWKDTLKDSLRELSFSDKMAVASPKTIYDFIRFVETGDFTILAEYPAMVVPQIVEQRDRISFGLQIFGNQAPSINFSSQGKTFNIPSPNAADPNLTVPAGGSRPLKYIPVKIEPFSIAVQQWREVFFKGRIVIADGRKGRAEFTDMRKVALKIANDPKFTEIYESLKRAVHLMKDSPVRKRRRDRDDDGAEEKAGKKSKVDESLMDI